uniref:hypothetical protein n=1 Tax=Mariniflexile sp. TaxID=1979402 RepID=UPI004048955D
PPDSGGPCAQTKTYDITSAVWKADESALQNYQLFAPVGTGKISGEITARTVDVGTGASSEPATKGFLIQPELVLDVPELALSGVSSSLVGGNLVHYLELSEDASDETFGLLSFSPDPMEYVSVTLTLSTQFKQGGGKLSLESTENYPGNSGYGLIETPDDSGIYTLTWEAAGSDEADGSAIPSFNDRVEILVIPGPNYASPSWDSDNPAPENLIDELVITSTSAFDNEAVHSENPYVTQTVKLAIVEVNDKPESDAQESKGPDVSATMVAEGWDEDLLWRMAGSEFDFADADPADSHAITLEWGTAQLFPLSDNYATATPLDRVVKSPTPVLLDEEYWRSGGANPYAANLAVLAGLLKIEGEEGGSLPSADGYDIELFYESGANYWFLPDMSGIFKAKVRVDDEGSRSVAWDLLISEEQQAFLAEDEQLVQIYSLAVQDYDSSGDIKQPASPLLVTVDVVIKGRNDLPEFVDAFGLSGEKTSTEVFEVNGLTNEGRSQTSVSLFFVDPDVSQSEANYTAAWVDDPMVFATSGLVFDRLFSDTSQELLGGNLDVVYAGEYAVASQGIRESIYEIQGVLPQANTLIAYKTASEEMTLEVSVELYEVSSKTTIKASLTFTFDDVILPNFDLLFNSSTSDATASQAYRQALFYGNDVNGGQEATGNDFSKYAVSNGDITQITPEYGQIVSTFLPSDGAMPLHGRDIAGQPDAGFAAYPPGDQPFSSSNIYGTSGRDIILATGEGGSLLYGGDETAHDVMIGSKGNDLFVLGGGVDYVAGSQVPVFVHDEDIYVVSSLIDYAEMEVAGMTDLLGVYFSSNAEKMANEIAAHVNALGVDNAYVVGIIEDLALSPVDSGYEAIDRVYFDGFAALTSGELDQQLLTTGEVLLTQTFTSSAGETEAFSLLLSMSDTTYDYENAIFIS